MGAYLPEVGDALFSFIADVEERGGVHLWLWGESAGATGGSSGSAQARRAEVRVVRSCWEGVWGEVRRVDSCHPEPGLMRVDVEEGEGATCCAYVC